MTTKPLRDQENVNPQPSKSDLYAQRLDNIYRLLNDLRLDILQTRDDTMKTMVPFEYEVRRYDSLLGEIAAVSDRCR